MNMINIGYKEKDYLESHPELINKLMDTAISFAELSKCAAKHVACLLYKDGNIISLGINGTPSGNENCNNLFKKEDGKWYTKSDEMQIDGDSMTFRFSIKWVECDSDAHHKWSLLHECHAEVNAISKALVPVEGSTAFITHSPCFNCAKTLIAFGIRDIYYRYEYDDFDEVLEFLNINNVRIHQI